MIKEKMNATMQVLPSSIIRFTDPEELRVILNELFFNLKIELGGYEKSCYWVAWILEWEKKNKKDKKCFEIEERKITNVNPKYLSSDTRWIKSKERNPDWVKKPGCSFDLIRFKWIRDEDTRADHEKNRFIYTYGVKKNIKGKNTPVFVIEETGNYTFIMKLNSPYYTKKNIKKMDVILRR